MYRKTINCDLSVRTKAKDLVSRLNTFKPGTPINILYVCMQNIERSQFAERATNYLIDKNGLSDLVKASSCCPFIKRIEASRNFATGQIEKTFHYSAFPSQSVFKDTCAPFVVDAMIRGNQHRAEQFGFELPGNWQNNLGKPLTLANIEKNDLIITMEKPGETARTSKTDYQTHQFSIGHYVEQFIKANVSVEKIPRQLAKMARFNTIFSNDFSQDRTIWEYEDMFNSLENTLIPTLRWFYGIEN